jgi:maleylacetoacetate isomerase
MASGSQLPFKALHLYTAPLSGCSARVRIIANLKSVPLIYHNISLANAQQATSSYLSINPNASVPSLVIEPPDDSTAYIANHTITQSTAIFDFLESHFPTPPLLPSVEKIKERSRALEFASLVACDIQPPQNSRIRKKINEMFGGDGEAWARYVYERGFGVYETLLNRTRQERLGEISKKADLFSVGGEVTLADVFLVPAAQGALRVGVDLERWSLLSGVVERCWKLEAFRKGGLGGHGRLIP